MTWLLGFSNEPEDVEYVEIAEHVAVKVFSICQDLVYVCSKGQIQTPKSLALAMTVRRISGCSNLIKILNGLGHCEYAESPAMEEIHHQYQDYILESSRRSRTFFFWSMHIKMV